MNQSKTFRISKIFQQLFFNTIRTVHVKLLYLEQPLTWLEFDKVAIVLRIQFGDALTSSSRVYLQCDYTSGVQQTVISSYCAIRFCKNIRSVITGINEQIHINPLGKKSYAKLNNVRTILCHFSATSSNRKSK